MKSSILFFSMLFLFVAVEAQAASRTLTVFSDAVLVEIEVVARKGVAELSLPAPLRDGTLRVKPLDGGTVGRVDLLLFKMPDKQQKELDSLVEQKSRLEDRLKALDTREEIFAAAAKSQSSKAPRKTKTNPDPLASVRQGTDFAIAQLETVLTARRRTVQELKKVEARLEQARQSATGGPTVRVQTSQPAGRIRVAALLADGGWKPRYEIRLDGGPEAQVAMFARTSTLPEGFLVKVAASTVATGLPDLTVSLPPGFQPRIGEWRLPVEKGQALSSALPSFSFSITNSSGMTFSAGETSVYSNGEYLGTVMLPETVIGTSFSIRSP